MFIVLDGPEKAGKTTLARALVDRAVEQGLTAKYRRFSGIDPVTVDALNEAMDDIDEYRIVVWDRSWASGYVYESLGFSQSPEAIQEEGERLFASLDPMKVMLLGPSVDALVDKRTPDDLPVHPAFERSAFQDYARRHGWAIVKNPHTLEELDRLVHSLGNLTDRP